jgi:hypothetical protein
MSWITDIAGKAETFLNKIDQNAALLVETNIATDIQLELEEEHHLQVYTFKIKLLTKIFCHAVILTFSLYDLTSLNVSSKSDFFGLWLSHIHE